MENHESSNPTAATTATPSSTGKNLFLLFINCLILSVGNCGGPLIMRLYYLHGGERVWLSAFLETGGWPVILIPLIVSYIKRRKKEGSATKVVIIKPFLFISGAIIGIITGLDDYIYAYGISKLPVSTSSLIISTQLAFTALFAFFLVSQKFTSYSVNAVFLLTIGAVVLALHSSSDRPEGESNEQYWMGFGMVVAAAVLYGFVLPCVELANMKAGQAITFTVVMEFQIVMSFFATAFCAVGMIISNDFQAIPKEARACDLGESGYYIILILSAILWQGFFMGAVGVIYCSSSLLSGVVIAVLLPVTEVLAVVFYSEKFTSEKGLSLVLSLWGFISYFYGEYKEEKRKKSELEKNNEVPLQDASLSASSSHHKSPQVEVNTFN